MAEKEYGKLTLDQFKGVVKQLPELRNNLAELPSVLRATKPEKFKEIFDKDFAWAEIYELSLVEQIAFTVIAMGELQRIIDIAASDDPQKAALEWANEDPPEWKYIEGGFEKKHAAGLVIALQRTILSIMIYHRPINDLVAEVRAGKDGADEAFFKAVRVDRSILACPTFADRLAKAEMTNDRDFFIHLRSALKGLSKKHWESYRDLRYALFILKDLGFSQQSDAQLENLLVHQLKLYPNSPSARKNLRKQFTESKKFATTSK